MQVRFWGTRVSIPTSITAGDVQEKTVNALLAASGRTFADATEARAFTEQELSFAGRATYGGSSSCVEVDPGAGDFIVCDMGSGFRAFGIDAFRRIGEGRPKRFNIFMSHLHWDHIMGFPFCGPAYDPETEINFYGGHADMEKALRRQQETISFPVPFDFMAAKINFHPLTPGETYEVAGHSVQLIRQYHDNDSYGYRFEKGGKCVVYSTDSEHKDDDPDADQAFVEFFDKADLVVFDTMYTLAESLTMKEDWGHSSGMVAVDMCHRAAAKRLAMFHHEPIFDDATLESHHEDTARYEELMRDESALEVLCAYDGLTVDL
ncbi:MAG: MBL fold metallo-hydrolase [Rhodospirillaceae bacterium]|nr:MBL fold metallo-hydrolase [Rhodospirillaceae bacterium]